MDRAAFSAIAEATHGLSPATMLQAWSDWAMHLAVSPGKQMQLASKGARKWARLAGLLTSTRPVIDPLPQDHRFTDPAWQGWPFFQTSQSFLLAQQWWHAATTGVMGVTRHHEAIVEFAARQILDTIAPSNFVATNPVLQKRIAETGGRCLVDGMKLFLEDFTAALRGEPHHDNGKFVVGETIAVTPGKVVFRNRLIELIQYEPTTEKVRPEPVLIVPAWIMKYYILDLSPDNSLIRWLTGQGYTVFAISWHNPASEDRDLDMEDYRLLGPMAALDAITAITGREKVHALGYCLGGTLLTIAAAAMARDGDDRLATVTLLAAQTDFSEPGELALFIDEAQLNLLENMMWASGYLDASQMGGAFQLLRSNDLIWSRILKSYLMGERDEPSDLMAWNADGTRMPYAMHSEYLRKLFLEDALAESHFEAGGKVVNLSALQAPVFMVGTESDHVAPWKSVFKLHALTPAEITFVLTSGGHNAGIVSEPGHAHRHYRVLEREADAPALSPDDWLERAQLHDGSWWTAWASWLGKRSGAPCKPPPTGNPDKGYPPLGEAPGTYVMES
ncbi:MAG: alpha/beta fold hydrolase [Novosphingobium sp.]|nr:alpha/beta fold hydrolase [Novosphingobium sp.]